MPVLEFLEEWTTEGLEEISPSVIPKSTKVFVNGLWVGVHREPQTLVRTLRHLRRQNDVHMEVGVIHDFGLQELRLYTDYGRTSRPLFIVEDQQLMIKKNHIKKLLDK
jgi:DNA-directed RNA polymerase II subunit RPB2